MTEFTHISEAMAGDRIHEAFVSLWQKMISDIPLFEKAQATSLAHIQFHEHEKEAVIDRLMENQRLKLRNLSWAYPLAVLDALDTFLYERYGAHQDAPVTWVRHHGDTYMVHRRVRPGRTIRHALQTGHILTYMNHHRIIPEAIDGLKVRVKKMILASGLKQKNTIAKKSIRVYVGSFNDGIGPFWDQSILPNFLALGLTDREGRWETLVTCLDAAWKAKADIVVFPELTLCPTLRDRVSLWMDEHDHPFYFVLPGTFHQALNGHHYNYAELFAANGKRVLCHKKIKKFGELDGFEHIHTGDHIELLDTPMGLIGMPICKDFCDEGAAISGLWQKIGVDWFFVPAYGGQTSIRAHERRAAVLNRAHGAITVLSNQSDGEEPVYGFVCSADGQANVSEKKRFISIGLEYKS